MLIDGGARNDVINTVPIEGDQYVCVRASINGGAGNDIINSVDGDVTTINGRGGSYTAYTDSFDLVSNFAHHYIGSAIPQKLTGNVIGTAGSYQNDGNTIAKVFDGNLSNYFDGPTATGDWAGLDF